MTTLSPEALLVRAALEAQGLETPLVTNELNSQQKREKIEGHMRAIMETLGLDLTDDSLAETPHRIAKMYVNEIFSGLDLFHLPQGDGDREQDAGGRDDHGTGHQSHQYLRASLRHHRRVGPCGLHSPGQGDRALQNQPYRAVLARRPQVQERLTQQILLALQTLLGTKDVAISIKATHYCVKARGVMDSTSYTTTTSLGGVFKTQPDTRAEFLSGLKS